MTEAEYRTLVLTDYHGKLKADLLPAELVNPARKDLKQHCISACIERYNSKDEPVLSSFFGKKENKEAYIIAMKRTVAEKFKTLHNFLNDESINTDFNNIKLLAWMIDFQPRPYHPDLKSPEASNTNERGSETAGQTDAEDKRGATDQTTSESGTRKRHKKITMMGIFTGVALLAGSLYVIYKMTRPTGLEKCMIWSEDHYVPVNCTEKIIHVTIFPIDHRLIDNFKKITRPDTLTLYSVKKVWYIKTKGRVEFYTSPGPYPLDSTKRLLPMTDHILKKYVYHLTD